MKERRNAWYLLTGLLIGLAIGVVVSVWVAPVQFSRIAPQSLGEEYKGAYRNLIAMSFAANGDLGRARARLTLLQDVNPAAVFSAQAQRQMASGGNAQEASALSALGEALLNANVYVFPTAEPEDTAISTGDAGAEQAQTTSATSATQAPAATHLQALQPTVLPETEDVVFSLDEQHPVCDEVSDSPELQIEVLDDNGQPLPGISIVVTWTEGEDRFVTGLHPQQSPGYADFSMQTGVVYGVQAGSQGQPGQVTAPLCTGSDGETYAGSLWLTFIQS